jgi:uroporphyrinogen decarboxylase
LVDIEKYLHGLEVKPDELTALERDRLYSQGKPVDRIPCVLDTGETMAPLMGMSIADYYHSAEKMCDLEVYLQEHFHSDGAGLSTTLRGMAEAMGSEIAYFDNNVAQLKTPALKSLDEVGKAKLVDVDKDGRLPIILKALAMVKEKLGATVPVGGTVTGPFTIAAMVVGTQTLLKGLRKHPDQVKELMEVIVENNNRYIERLLDIGVGIGFADPVSSSSIIRAEQYREFSLPYLKKNVDFIKSRGGGCGLHICGKSRALWDDIITSGIGTFGPDNVEDMAEAKEVLGPHMCIQGNVPPVEVMLYGTPYDVLRSARESIRKAYDSPRGFVLTSGCQMPVGTPRENMTALMDAARIFGRWPVDPSLLEGDEDESLPVQ